MTDPWYYRGATELARAIRAREVSPVELTRQLLDRIERLEPSLNAFRSICPERALAEARSAEIALHAGQDRGPLHGIPYVVKDLFDVRGLPTSAGSRLLETHVADADATAVARMARSGMVLLGKTNTVQFAYGGAGVNHDHGTPHNPWQETHHVPGGSSSGSAVAVSAGLAPIGLGTDTGGSVRIPAALCGITGLKTTLGQVSRAGVYPLSWTLDTVGPLARSVEDAALVYRSLQGPDRDDPTTHGRALEDVLGRLASGVSGLRIAFAESAFWDGAEEGITRAVRACGAVFEELGAEVFSIAFAEAEAARQLNPAANIVAAEAYTLNRRLVDEHEAELDPIVVSRMIQGRGIAAHEYLATLREREALCRLATEALADVDAVLCPTTAIPARPLAQVDADAESYSRANVLYLRNTAIGNILGLCGLSVPCGFTSSGLPVGLMIYGKAFDEPTLLRVGHAFQQATDWHRRHPGLQWAGDGEVDR